MNRGLLFDDSEHGNTVGSNEGLNWRQSDDRREHAFVINSMREHSTHSQDFRKGNRPNDRVLPNDTIGRKSGRLSDLDSGGDHIEYRGLYSEGGQLGGWRPPPDPQIAIDAAKRKRCFTCVACAGVLILLLALLGMFLVPVVVQGSIDASTFSFTSIINMTHPTPDSFRMSAYAQVVSSSPTKATIAPPTGSYAHSLFFDVKTNKWRKFGKVRCSANPCVNDAPLREARRNAGVLQKAVFNLAPLGASG